MIYSNSISYFENQLAES